MEVQQAYDIWSEQYDTNHNRTRDLEGLSLRKALAAIPFTSCLEIGCGTGKNTVWLAPKASVTAVDLSAGMLTQAREKPETAGVHFAQADITQDWNFTTGTYDLITFSLVLEHIADIEAVLQKATGVLNTGGHIYIGELHPFKQYTGSQARFDTAEGRKLVPCFTHHLSDFTAAAQKCGLQLVSMDEFFDEDHRKGIPRILVLIVKKIQEG